MASSAARQIEPAQVACVDCGKVGKKNTDVYPRAGPGKPRCRRCAKRRKDNGPCPGCDRGLFRVRACPACKRTERLKALRCPSCEGP